MPLDKVKPFHSYPKDFQEIFFRGPGEYELFPISRYSDCTREARRFRACVKAARQQGIGEGFIYRTRVERLAGDRTLARLLVKVKPDPDAEVFNTLEGAL